MTEPHTSKNGLIKGELPEVAMCAITKISVQKWKGSSEISQNLEKNLKKVKNCKLVFIG